MLVTQEITLKRREILRQMEAGHTYRLQKDIVLDITKNPEQYPEFRGLTEGSLRWFVRENSTLNKHKNQRKPQTKNLSRRNNPLVQKLPEPCVAADDISGMREHVVKYLDELVNALSCLQQQFSELRKREVEHECPDTTTLNAIIAEKEVQLRRLRGQYEDLHRQYTAANQENECLKEERDQIKQQKSDPDEDIKYQLRESQELNSELKREVERLTLRCGVLAEDLRKKQTPIGLHNMAIGSEMKFKNP